MPGKRKAVPKALHAELTEYAALIRALRTSHTLDLSAQLIQHERENSLYEDDPDDLGTPHAEGSRMHSAAPSTDTNSVTDAASLASKRRKAKEREKNLWTRWPLMPGDIPAPEWAIEDEVKSVALNILKHQEQFMPQDGEEEEDDDDNIISPSAVTNLTAVASSFLHHLFAMVSHHLTKAEKSMQNRFKPISWEDILAICGSSGLVRPEALEIAQIQLQAIYGPTKSLAVSRSHLRTEIYKSLNATCSSVDDSFFSFNAPEEAPDPTKNKRKRGKYKLTGKYKRRKVATTSEAVADVPEVRAGTEETDSTA